MYLSAIHFVNDSGFVIKEIYLQKSGDTNSINDFVYDSANRIKTALYTYKFDSSRKLSKWIYWYQGSNTYFNHDDKIKKIKSTTRKLKVGHYGYSFYITYLNNKPSHFYQDFYFGKFIISKYYEKRNGNLKLHSKSISRVDKKDNIYKSTVSFSKRYNSGFTHKTIKTMSNDEKQLEKKRCYHYITKIPKKKKKGFYQSPNRDYCETYEYISR